MMREIDRARGLRLDTTNRLKRLPTGFPADSPYGELLRQKDFCLEKAISEREVLAGGLVERLVEEFRRTQPFVARLNRAIRYAREEMC